MATYKDLSGQTYQSPGKGPATSGTQVKINTSNGSVNGTMVGSHVVPNKK